jgi:splicing factor U2AF 65 kDa subunit
MRDTLIETSRNERRISRTRSSSSSSRSSRSSRSRSNHTRTRSSSSSSSSSSKSRSRTRSNSERNWQNSRKRGRSPEDLVRGRRSRSPERTSTRDKIEPILSLEEQLNLLQEQTQLRLNGNFTHPNSQRFPIPPVVVPNARDRNSNSIELRELFVGNIPPTSNEKALGDFLNFALKLGGLVNARVSNSVKVGYISGHLLNKYAFIQFKTAQQASNALNLHNIPFHGNNLQFRRPTKYLGPPTPHLTWQQLILAQSNQIQMMIHSPNRQSPPALILNQVLMRPPPATPPPAFTPTLSVAPSEPQSSFNTQEVAFREVYVGGIPTDLDESLLIAFFSSAMQRLCLTLAPTNPILHCRLQPKFAFLEFRSSQEASNCLNLNGIPFMGHLLRVSRPTNYLGPLFNFYSWGELAARWVSGELKLLLSGSPSPVIQLSNMVSQDDRFNSTVIEEIIWDLNNECEQYGTLLAVEHEPMKGHFYIHLDTIDSSRKALISLKGRTYGERIVNAKFFPLDHYAVSSYSDLPCPILSASGLCTLEEIIGLALARGTAAVAPLPPPPLPIPSCPHPEGAPHTIFPHNQGPGSSQWSSTTPSISQPGLTPLTSSRPLHFLSPILNPNPTLLCSLCWSGDQLVSITSPFPSPHSLSLFFSVNCIHSLPALSFVSSGRHGH